MQSFDVLSVCHDRGDQQAAHQLVLFVVADDDDGSDANSPHPFYQCTPSVTNEATRINCFASSLSSCWFILQCGFRLSASDCSAVLRSEPLNARATGSSSFVSIKFAGGEFPSPREDQLTDSFTRSRMLQRTFDVASPAEHADITTQCVLSLPHRTSYHLIALRILTSHFGEYGLCFSSSLCATQKWQTSNESLQQTKVSSMPYYATLKCNLWEC